MSKKYLAIPEMIHSSQWLIIKRLYGHYVPEIFSGERAFVDDPLDIIPEGWIREIKEPMTFEKWISRKCQSLEWKKMQDFTGLDMQDCHEWTLANEKLKHEPKQSFDEWFGTWPSTDAILDCREEAERAWKAALKNRGYDE